MGEAYDGAMTMVIIRCGCGLQTYEPNHQCPSPKAIEYASADRVTVTKEEK